MEKGVGVLAVCAEASVVGAQPCIWACVEMTMVVQVCLWEKDCRKRGGSTLAVCAPQHECL